MAENDVFLLTVYTWPHKTSEVYNINVYTPEISTVWPPLGLAYVASSLLYQGNDVKIFDRNSTFFRLESIEKVDAEMTNLVLEYNPDIVGVSATTPLVLDAFRTAKIIKKIDSRIKVIIGGVHATALPRKTLLDCEHIDIVVRGEGEETFVEICAGKNLEDIEGISYRSEVGEIVTCKSRKANPNIDKTPYPARHLLDMEFYLRPSTQVIFGYKCRATSIISSRGCPNSCAFCAGAIMSQNKVRFHSPEYTINEMKELIEVFGIEGLFFVDEMFTTNKERILYLCDRIIQEGMNKKIVWGAQLRADYIDKEVLLKMKEAGCVQVEYGFESGSNKILNDMKKKLTVEQSIKTAEITHGVGIRQLANIIVGWPTEQLNDLIDTIEFVKKINVDFVAWHEFKPLPGSYGWKYAKDWDIESDSFEKNEPFLFCNVSEEERKQMLLLYRNASDKTTSNNSKGLYVD